MGKGDDKDWITTYVPKGEKKRLRVLAAERGVSVAALVADLIGAFMAKEAKKK